MDKIVTLWCTSSFSVENVVRGSGGGDGGGVGGGESDENS